MADEMAYNKFLQAVFSLSILSFIMDENKGKKSFYRNQIKPLKPKDANFTPKTDFFSLKMFRELLNGLKSEQRIENVVPFYGL